MEDVGAKKTHCCEKATITHKGAREDAFCVGDRRTIRLFHQPYLSSRGERTSIIRSSFHPDKVHSARERSCVPNDLVHPSSFMFVHENGRHVAKQRVNCQLHMTRSRNMIFNGGFWIERIRKILRQIRISRDRWVGLVYAG